MACQGAGCTTFTNICRANILQLGGQIPGLVDQYGAPMSQLNNNTWGVTYPVCEEHCGFAKIAMVCHPSSLGAVAGWTAHTDRPQGAAFEFPTFASAMTSYFLPWLTLTAQLPFQNAGPRATFMALCLAIGSPALITYSLALTILNRNWVVDEVEQLLKRSQRVVRPEVAVAMGHFKSRLRSFSTLAIEGQQVPLRASVIDHWLSSLIAHPGAANTAWWTSVSQSINRGRRKPSFSLHAQISLAILVWAFTLITGISAATGAITTAIQIATSTLWVWLVRLAFRGPHSRGFKDG